MTSENTAHHKLVTSAIADKVEDLASNGVNFNPFLVKSSTNMVEIWCSILDTNYQPFSNKNLGLWFYTDAQDAREAISKFSEKDAAEFKGVTFYQIKGDAGFFPLGDTAIYGTGAPEPKSNGTLLFSQVEGSEALAHPTEFVPVFYDNGSRNPRDVYFWRPVPPAGYDAVGICFTNAKDSPPDINQYWCVNKDYLEEVDSQVYWNDAGSGWEHEGDLLIPSFARNGKKQAPDGKMLLLPPTVSNLEVGVLFYALIAEQAFLDIPSVEAGDFHKIKNPAQSSQSDYGLKKIAIVPHTTIAENLYHKAERSPFYFIAAEPYWYCTQSKSTDEGGTYETTYDVGVSQSDSSTFSESTSLTISAETGIESGGFSAKITASYTQDFGIEKTATKEHSSEVTKTTTLNLKSVPTTWFWQRIDCISIYRADGTILSSINYKTSDSRMSFSDDNSDDE